MENMNYFRKLFEYDHWANRETLASLASAGPATDAALKIFGHVVGAQRIWLFRIEPEPSGPPEVWPALSLEDCKTAVAGLHDRWTTLLDKLNPAELAESVTYRNTKGVEFKTPLEGVLQHVVMHSTYHRGQVAIAVRHAGGKPAVTDYVAYLRQQS
jgi:uncharacterized damage-inducible protein DinB